jgi:hypothetical protein
MTKMEKTKGMAFWRKDDMGIQHCISVRTCSGVFFAEMSPANIGGQVQLKR